MIFLPCLANVDHIDPIWTGLPQIWLHMHLEVFRAQVTLSGQKHLNVLGGGVEHGRELCWCHLVDLDPLREEASRGTKW